MVETAAPRAHATDAALLRAVAAGDRVAFAHLYEMHRGPAFRLAYGVLLDRDEACEAVQDAFLRLYEGAARWQPNAAIGTWLYRVVLNHCLSLRRRLLRFGRGAAPTSVQASPERAAVLGEAMAIVERSLAELGPRQRAVLTLRLDGGLDPCVMGTVDMSLRNAPLPLVFDVLAHKLSYRYGERDGAILVSCAEPGAATTDPRLEKRLAVSVRETPLRAVLAEVASGAGLAGVDYRAASEPKVTITLGNARLGTLLAALADETGLRLAVEGEKLVATGR